MYQICIILNHALCHALCLAELKPQAHKAAKASVMMFLLVSFAETGWSNLGIKASGIVADQVPFSAFSSQIFSSKVVPLEFRFCEFH